MAEVITLRDVTDDNLIDVIKLSDTLTDLQKTCVASNEFSMAQAYIYRHYAWPKAIYLDEQPIGFVMLALENEDAPKEEQPSYYLWRFMIKRDHQQKGYGRNVLDLIVEKCRQENVKSLYTSCNEKTEQPYGFILNMALKTHSKSMMVKKYLRCCFRFLIFKEACASFLFFCVTMTRL